MSEAMGISALVAASGPMAAESVSAHEGGASAHEGHHLEPLVRRAARGDVQAFGQLVASTNGLVSSIALAIVRDADQSHDIAQEVFLSAWRDLGRLRNPASFLAWLRQMTRNQAHSSLRRRVRGRRRFTPLSDEQHAETITDGQPSAVESLLTAEQQVILCEALAELPDDTRESLTLFYRQGQSIAQTAALLELSEDAVKKRLSRAREALRQGVFERLGETLGVSAPGAAFSATVLAAIPFSTTAKASVVTASAAKAGSGSASLVWLFKAILPVTVLSGPAVIAAWFNARRLLRIARDERERRDLRRFWATNMALFVATAAGFEIREQWFAHWGDLVVFGAFTLALYVQLWIWFPKIIQRRHDAEMREDPVNARAKRRREKLGKILGWSLGMGGAWIGLLIKHLYYAR